MTIITLNLLMNHDDYHTDILNDIYQVWM